MRCPNIIACFKDHSGDGFNSTAGVSIPGFVWSIKQQTQMKPKGDCHTINSPTEKIVNIWEGLQKVAYIEKM